MSNATNFRKADRAGDAAVKLVTEQLTRYGVDFTEVAKTSSEQARGDIRLNNAKMPTYIEVKANENYDDDKQWFNIYFEIVEIYKDDYTNNKAKAHSVEIVGALKQLELDSRTIFAHKMGSTDNWIVYDALAIVKYFNENKESSWRLDSIPSWGGQAGKSKLGIRIKRMHPDTLMEDFARSELSKYAFIVPTNGVVRAVSEAIKRSEHQQCNSVAAYKKMMLNFHADKQDDFKRYYWFTWPTSTRKVNL